MKKNHKQFLSSFIFSFVMLLSVQHSFAKTQHDIHLSTTPHDILVIDSIDYRTDLTRIYGKFIGRKFAPFRVISITGATDIDGIEFAKWFQFDEHGLIPVEIDFVAQKPKKPMQFVITTNGGNFICNITEQ